jgi:Tol biopolymer transport system component
MGRPALILAAVLSGATACGSAASLRSAVPLRNVLVYSRPSALTYAAADKPYTIWRARLDGSHAQQLGVGDYPAVSPDGRWVAFERGPSLLVMPTAGGATVKVYALGGKDGGLFRAPTWSPDSRRFVFDDNRGLVVLDPFSRQARPLPERAEDFAFSPDSRKIAYDKGGDLYVIPARGGTPVRLTFDHRSTFPVWGKPGIAFFRYLPRRQWQHWQQGDIWLRNPRTHRLLQLTHTGDYMLPAYFSADGKKLLAWYPPSHNGHLWAVDMASGTERSLTPWIDLRPHGLSADGKTVLAVLGCDGAGGIYGDVETIPFAGGKPHVIVAGPCGASWNAR